MKMTKRKLQRLSADECNGPDFVADFLPAEIHINPEKNFKLARKLVEVYSAQDDSGPLRRSLEADLDFIIWKQRQPYGGFDSDIDNLPAEWDQDPYIVAQVLGWLADFPGPRV